jgi:PAS domain S-box-containing protein
MIQHITYYSVLFICNTFVSFFVAVLAWQRKHIKGARELVNLMLSVGLWCFFNFFETASVTQADKIFWSKLCYLGAISTPVFYLFFVFRYVGKDTYNSITRKILFFIIPAITLVLVLTNEYHHLIWTGFSPISEQTNMMEYYHGIGFWISYVIYNYMIWGIATVFLFRFIFVNWAGISSKGLIIFAGGLFPWVASIVYLSNHNPLPGFDLVPASIIFSGILFAYSILNVWFFDLTPMARETLVENLTDGILAIDSQNRIQDINGTALMLLAPKNKDVLGVELTKIHSGSQNLIDAIIETSSHTIVEAYINSELKYLVILKQKIRNHPNSKLIIIRDVTIDKIVKDKLESSERRYRELTEFLPEMICEMQLNGKVLYANQFALSKFGFSAEDVSNGVINVFDIFDSDELPRVYANLDKALKNVSNSSNEYTVVKRNGEKFPALVYSSPIYNNNVMVGIRGVMVDITDRKNQELQIAKNLRQQEILSQISLNYNSSNDFKLKTNEALKIIGEHTQVSRVYIFEDDVDGLHASNTFEWCNKGITSQITELQDVPYLSIPSLKEALLKEGILYSENIEELPKDLIDILKPQEILSIIVLPLFLDGHFFGFVGFDECLRYRKWTKSEIELLRTVSNLVSNAYLRNKINNNLINSLNEISGIINSIPDIIVRFSDKGRIVSYDSQVHHGLFSGIKAGEKEFINDIFEEELSNSFITAINDCLIDGHFSFDFTYFGRSELQYYEARFVRLKEDEVLAIIRNVTESKEQEKQLQVAKMKAEEASRAKSEFLANVSHEIRTPMNAILGFSEWLYDNSLDELHKSYLHTILSSGKNLLALINDILDLSKIESGKMTLHMEPMQCRMVISEINQVLKQKLEGKNLAFDVHIDRSVPNYIFMDEVRFYQILFNIVSNAVKFTEKGYIHITAYATNSLTDNVIDLNISVEDTGIGISEDQRENIFKAFTQQSGQSNRHYEGTGLGLSIVSGLLKKLNGEIKLKSKPGKGSTFMLKFREVSVAEIADQGSPVLEINRNFKLTSGKILIVDDVNFNIQVLKRIINSDAVTYLEANNGQEALDILMSETPDIIFMDIRMPGMSGYAVTHIIKNNEKLSKIPVVAFTASTMHDDADAIDNLFDAFLQKPVFKKDIMAVLSRFLPNQIGMTEKVEVKDESPAITTDCREILPEVLEKLETSFFKEWERIKDDLIIFDIEDFHRNLTEFGEDNNIPSIGLYCKELNICLQSFDIDAIRLKLNEFPILLDKFKENS